MTPPLSVQRALAHQHFMRRLEGTQAVGNA